MDGKMPTRLALRDEQHPTELMPAYKGDSSMVVNAQAMQKMQENIVKLTLYVQEKGRDYEAITEKMQGRIDGLERDKKVLTGRLGELEGALKGSQEAQRAMQGALQQQKKENGYLQQLVRESSVRNVRIEAD